MLDDYFRHVAERQQLGIPPLPLTPEQTSETCRLLEEPPAGKEALLLELIRERVAPGVDAAAKVKATRAIRPKLIRRSSCEPQDHEPTALPTPRRTPDLRRTRTAPEHTDRAFLTERQKRVNSKIAHRKSRTENDGRR